MNHPEQLESNAVVPAKIDRESRGSGVANQANRCVIPLGVGDLRGGHLPLGDFAGRKDGEHAALVQPTQSLTQSPAVRFHGTVGLKGIDKDAMILELGYISEQDVGEHFYVWTNPGKQNREQRTIENTVGMIRDHHDGTSGRDSRLIGGIDMEIDSHLGEQAFELEALGRTLYAPIQVSYFADRRQLSDEAGNLCDAR